MVARNPSVISPLVDKETGIISGEWLAYFVSLATSGPSLEQRPTAPANPLETQSYYDTTLHKARTWDGSTWQNWW